MKKVNIFCHSFQKVKPILYRFITQSEIFQAFISWNFDDYGYTIIDLDNENPKFSVSENLYIT